MNGQWMVQLKGVYYGVLTGDGRGRVDWWDLHNPDDYVDEPERCFETREEALECLADLEKQDFTGGRVIFIPELDQ